MGKIRKRKQLWARTHVDLVHPRLSGPLEIRPLNEADSSRDRLSVLHIRLPPGSGHPSIRHLHTHEWVIVMSGSAKARIDNKAIALRPGDYLHLPPGIWHAFQAGKQGVEAVSIFSPSLDWNHPDIEVKS
jgi:quercetin dioxygenase-like cupin family protein